MEGVGRTLLDLHSLLRMTSACHESHDLIEAATEAQLNGHNGRLLVQLGGRNVVRLPTCTLLSREG